MALHLQHGVVCDFCRKKVYEHVCIGARKLTFRQTPTKKRPFSWGFFEGHQRCWPLLKRKLKMPLKAGTITRYNYR